MKYNIKITIIVVFFLAIAGYLSLRQFRKRPVPSKEPVQALEKQEAGTRCKFKTPEEVDLEVERLRKEFKGWEEKANKEFEKEMELLDREWQSQGKLGTPEWELEKKVLKGKQLRRVREKKLELSKRVIDLQRFKVGLIKDSIK